MSGREFLMSMEWIGDSYFLNFYLIYLINLKLKLIIFNYFFIFRNGGNVRGKKEKSIYSFFIILV
jgi:hypothetical protein